MPNFTPVPRSPFPLWRNWVPAHISSQCWEIPVPTAPASAESCFAQENTTTRSPNGGKRTSAQTRRSSGSRCACMCVCFAPLPQPLVCSSAKKPGTASIGSDVVFTHNDQGGRGSALTCLLCYQPPLLCVEDDEPVELGRNVV